MMKGFNNTKNYPRFVVFVLLIIAGVIMMYMFTSHKMKGGNKTGMFEKNSDSISIYFEERMILNIVGENQEQLVQYLKKIDLTDYEEKEKDDTYQYKIDCNNNWGVIYLSSVSSTCYLKNDDFKCYKIPEALSSFFFEVLLKNQSL